MVDTITYLSNFTNDGDWINVFHQLILFIIIFGKWMMPNSHITPDELSQILFIFIGAGLDIIEFVTETKKVCIRFDVVSSEVARTIGYFRS